MGPFIHLKLVLNLAPTSENLNQNLYVWDLNIRIFFFLSKLLFGSNANPKFKTIGLNSWALVGQKDVDSNSGSTEEVI